MTACSVDGSIQASAWLKTRKRVLALTLLALCVGVSAVCFFAPAQRHQVLENYNVSVAKGVQATNPTQPCFENESTTSHRIGSHVSTGSGGVDDNPYGINHWIASAAPECQYHGPEHGLFQPQTPHPRYIVTGGAGFIGSHLVKRLALETGPGQVKVIDNFWRGHLAKLQHANGSWPINPRLDVCSLDLRVESHAMKFIRGADYVYHLAGIAAGIKFMYGHQLSVYHDNVLINSNTIKASKVNGIRNYIYVGTACSRPQHLQIGLRIQALHKTQSCVADPKSNYGWSKLMGEYEAELARSANFNVGLLRLHNVYGPGSDPSADSGQVIPALFRKAIKYPDEPFMVWGSGQQSRDFVYVSDVVNALVLVKDKGMNRGVIEIGSGKATTTKKLATYVVQIVSRALRKQIPIYFDTSMPEGDLGRVAVVHRANTILGWQPQVTINDGLQSTYDWLTTRLNETRVLVVVNGQPRGGDLAWKSLHRHVLKPYKAHLATYLSAASPNGTLLEDMAQYAWRVPEYDDWGVVLDAAAALCPNAGPGAPNWREVCDYDNSIWGGGFAGCPRHKQSKSGINLAYRWLIGQKLMALNLLQHYEHVIYTRTDYLYLCDHAPLASLDSSNIWVPNGEEYGGLCDRHLVGTGPTVLWAINITTEMVCNPPLYHSVVVNKTINLEMLQVAMWKVMNVSAQQFAPVMFTVRSQGDPSSWSLGVDHPELRQFHLLTKYPGELEKSLATCQGVNITKHLNELATYRIE